MAAVARLLAKAAGEPGRRPFGVRAGGPRRGACHQKYGDGPRHGKQQYFVS
jgi:hypothetical protein